MNRAIIFLLTCLMTTGALPAIEASELPSLTTEVPTTLLPAVVRDLADATPGYGLQPDVMGYTARNEAHTLDLTFTTTEAQLSHADGALGLAVVGYGRGNTPAPTGTAALRAAGAHLIYDYDGLMEAWYTNAPHGLHQGFTLREAPAGPGDLVIELALSGTLNPVQVDDAILFQQNGETVLRYDRLAAWDAHDEMIPVEMTLDGDVLRIRVDDSGAAYPLTVDPFVQSRTYNGERSGDLFGSAVAASRDTVAVGAVGYDSSGSLRGRVYIYQRSGNNWSQTATRTYNGAAPLDSFGRSVALSSDGNTLVVGATGFDAGSAATGLVYIYERVGGVWGTEPTAFFAGATGEQLGWSVAADRDTVVAGTVKGRVYVYTRANGTWNSAPTRTYATGKLSDRFGHDVGVHDNTLVIGAPDTDVSVDRGFAGRVYVYTQVNGNWGTDPAAVYDGQSTFDRFGDAVAVYGDSIAVGAYGGGDNGRAYVYQRQGGSWPSSPARVYNGEADLDFFGASVSITQNALLVGAPHHDTNGVNTGRVYSYERAWGAAWPATPTEVITGENESDFFGDAVATAGVTSVVGARINHRGEMGNGRAYVYNGEGSNLGINPDVNGDGFVTPADVTFVLNRIGQPASSSTITADLDSNGIITETDAQIIIEALGTVVGS